MQHIIKILTHCIFRDDYRCFTVMLVLLHLEILLFFVCLSFFRLIYLLLCLFILCLCFSFLNFFYYITKYLPSLHILRNHSLQFLYLSPDLNFFLSFIFLSSFLSTAYLFVCLPLSFSLSLFLSSPSSFLYIAFPTPFVTLQSNISNLQCKLSFFSFILFLSPLSLYFSPIPPIRTSAQEGHSWIKSHFLDMTP